MEGRTIAIARVPTMSSQQPQKRSVRLYQNRPLPPIREMLRASHGYGKSGHVLPAQSDAKISVEIRDDNPSTTTSATVTVTLE
jgi:hypothetical protein